MNLYRMNDETGEQKKEKNGNKNRSPSNSKDMHLEPKNSSRSWTPLP